jgi:hypothetical protein
MAKEMNPWVRWLLVFALIAIGLAIFGAMFQSMKSGNSPLKLLSVFLIMMPLIVVLPGAIIGWVVSLASKKSILALRLMIAINTIMSVLMIINFAHKAMTM